MQVVENSNISFAQYKDLKSRHTLTDLLTEQIDLNEELSSENHLLASQQRKLISLLTQKDGQISKFRHQLSAPDLTSRSQTARHIQLTLFSHLWKRISAAALSDSFRRLKDSAKETSPPNSADSSIQKLSENLFAVQKSKAIKFLLLAGLNFKNRLENNGYKLYSLLMKLSQKQLFQSLGRIKEHTIILKANESRRIAAALLLNSALHNRIYLRLTDLGLHKIKERGRLVNKGLEAMCQRLCDAIEKRRIGRKREAFSRIQLKPYEDATEGINNVRIMSKKFIAIQLFFFQMSKLQQNLLWSGFAKLQSAGLKSRRQISLMVHALERNLGDLYVQKDAFLKLRMHNFAKSVREAHVKAKLQRLERTLDVAWFRGLTWAFKILNEKEAFSFPTIHITRRKKRAEKRSIRDLSFGQDEESGVFTNTWNKRRRSDQVRKGISVKKAHAMLKRTFVETCRKYSVQMANCIAMSRAKLMNFQQLNERILIESKEAIKKRQESDMELEAERKKVREMNKKVEELVKSSQQTVERRAQLNNELTQANRQLAEAGIV